MVRLTTTYLYAETIEYSTNETLVNALDKLQEAKMQTDSIISAHYDRPTVDRS